jgi:hypothetical protein
VTDEPELSAAGLIRVYPTFRTSRCNYLILFVTIKFDQNGKHKKIPRVRSEVRNVG